MGRRASGQAGSDSVAERRATRRHRAPAETPASTPVQWQVCGCAGLCALGATAGLMAVLHELSYHVQRSAQAVSYAGAALCVGALLGLWLPRRIIHRHLRTGAATPAADDNHQLAGDGAGNPDAGNELEFAAALAGSLILVLGLAWLLPCLTAGGMEGYRAFVGRHFVFPPQVMQVAVLAPACLGLLLVGAVGTTTLMALRGWFRVCAAPQANYTPLWLASLAAAALGAGVMTAVTDKAVLILAALLPTFAASALAVYRKPRGAGTAKPPPRTPWETVSVAPLLVVTVATFSAALAVILTVPVGSLPIAELGQAAAALATSSLLGLLVARAVPQRWEPIQLAPLLLLASAVVWAFANRWCPTPATASMGRLLGVACCTATCLGLVSRRLGPAWGSPQLAFTRVGGIAAAAGAAALILGPVLYVHGDAGTLADMVTIAVTATAGLALVFNPRGSKPLRIGGLFAVAGWLILVSFLGDSELPAAQSVSPDGNPVAETPPQRVARSLYERPGMAGVRVCGQRGSESPAMLSAWEVDCAGPRYAVVVIAAGEGEGSAPDRRTGRRLVRRCTRSLARGGYLVFELPAGGLATAALDVARGRRADGWGSYLLRVSGPDDTGDLLLIGPDVPAWVRQHPWPDGFEFSLHEVPRRRDLARHLVKGR